MSTGAFATRLLRSGSAEEGKEPVRPSAPRVPRGGWTAKAIGSRCTRTSTRDTLTTPPALKTVTDQLSAGSRAAGTPRLRIEPLRSTHAPLLFAALADSRIYSYIPDEAHPSVDSLTRRYAFLERGAPAGAGEIWLNWALRRADTAAYIGTLQATVTLESHAYIGYVFASSAWGRDSRPKPVAGSSPSCRTLRPHRDPGDGRYAQYGIAARPRAPWFPLRRHRAGRESRGGHHGFPVPPRARAKRVTAPCCPVAGMIESH